jgi:hypothetical protein
MTNNINNLTATNALERAALEMLRSGREPRGYAREVAIEMALRAAEEN